MLYLSTGQPDRLFRRALLIALLLHAGLIIAITFDIEQESHYRPQLDVTLAYQASNTAAEQASHHAQVNQLGSGDDSKQPDFSSQGSAAKVTAPPAEEQALQQQQDQQALSEHSLTTQADSERQQARNNAFRAQQEFTLDGISQETEQYSTALPVIDSLQDEQRQPHAKEPRVRRLNSLSAQAAVDAAYLDAWRRRVETVGNQYYPEASIRYGIYGSLRLLVVIQANGELEDIQVLSSSGYAMLDDAAIKIVRMAAPYAPFPAELRATTDRLEIIRTWQFQQNRLSSG